MTSTALILGASGKIGTHSRIAFEDAGWRVRLYNRQENMAEAARGADVIINGLNPPAYHNWAQLIPKLTEQVIGAAQLSGATVILPGNVYNFGATPGEWSESTPQEPNTRKGAIRAAMEQRYRDSGVRTVVLRAGNFIDPNGQDDVMTVLYLRALRSGKITLAGDPDVEQSYCYLPDWARAAVELAEQRDSLAAFEDVPFEGHTFTAQELRLRLGEQLGRPLKFATFPWWLLRLTSPFWELAREMLEMRYLWNTPHSLSGQKLQRLLPDFVPTPLDSVLQQAAAAA